MNYNDKSKISCFIDSNRGLDKLKDVVDLANSQFKEQLDDKKAERIRLRIIKALNAANKAAIEFENLYY